MTTRPRELNTPLISAQTMASRRTARGAHGFGLADLANDAATGHPRQRATILRNSGGTFHAFLHPLTTSRLLIVAATASWAGDWSPPDALKIKLSVDDGTMNIPYTDATIPRGFKDEARGPSAGTSRLDAMNRVVGYLDKDALATAGLDRTVPWRLTFIVDCGATVFCEMIEVAEVSRFRIDDGETFGEFPQNYRGRGIIDDHLVRVGATLEAAYSWNRRTYQSLSLAEAAPDVVTAAAWAAIPGSQSSAGTARAWTVRPRRILGEPQVLFGVRYQTSTAAGGDVRLHTSGAGSPFTLALPGTSGAWADALTGVATLADMIADSVVWEAQVSAGTLSLATYWISDDPL